jgi:nickel/cobalt transporter (NicO) family protein
MSPHVSGSCQAILVAVPQHEGSMPDIAAIIQSGVGNPWLLLPTALALGALHALEPGHSKSMMMAFIVAVRGTPRQAVLLGLSAAVGHTIVVWALALLAWRLGDAGLIERAEPWLMLLGGSLIVVLALRLLSGAAHSGHGHHSHRDGHSHSHSDGHSHSTPSDGPLDAHAAAHAAEIETKFAGRRNVGDFDVAWFGFTGGLLPCPAAFAVLLACLHLKNYSLGIVMVAAFSIGLAFTLVAVGLAASLGTEALKNRSATFNKLADWAPIVSGWIVLLIGVLVMAAGIKAFST